MPEISYEQFIETLTQDTPPELPNYFAALWWDHSGDWDRAHDCLQDDGGWKDAYVHAYLHRKEGDLSNANYWYNRAGKRAPKCSLREEWDSILRELIDNS